MGTQRLYEIGRQLGLPREMVKRAIDEVARKQIRNVAKSAPSHACDELVLEGAELHQELLTRLSQRIAGYDSEVLEFNMSCVTADSARQPPKTLGEWEMAIVKEFNRNLRSLRGPD